MKLLRARNAAVLSPLLLVLFMITLCFPFSAEAAKQGGVLKVALGMNPNKIDPANSKAGSDMMIGCAHIFEGLVNCYYDQKEKKTILQPGLAEKWERSPDGKTWTFYLRKNVRFHDGTPFNAEAVRFNIERTLKDEPRTSFRELKGIVEKAEMVDNYTIKMHCSKVVGHFLYLLGESTMMMVSPASVEKYGDKVGSHPTGTGPFKFVKWVPGERVELEVNKEYWRGRANLDGIVFRFVVDNSARINMLQTGEVDVVDVVPVQDHERLRKTGKIEVISWPTAIILRLFVNCQKPPTNDLKVRQALKLAIDRPGIIDAIHRGDATIAKSGVAPFSWGYYPAAEVEYNPDKARKLLTEAGWVDTNGDGVREKEGKNLSLKIRAPQAGRYPMDRESLLAIQENLRNVGVDCQIDFVEFAAFMNSLLLPLEKQDVLCFFVAYSSRTHAYFATYDLFHSKRWPPNGLNVFFYKNPKMDGLLDAAMVELNPEKSYELYKDVQILAEEEVPLINLWIMHLSVGQRKSVHDVRFNPIPVHEPFHLRDAWIE
jgi:peptide/nickel transport system substrate-binding protein